MAATMATAAVVMYHGRVKKAASFIVSMYRARHTYLLRTARQGHGNSDDMVTQSRTKEATMNHARTAVNLRIASEDDKFIVGLGVKLAALTTIDGVTKEPVSCT